jgi:hypothetical protein
MAKKTARKKTKAKSAKKASRSGRKASPAARRKRITVPVQSVVYFVKMLYDHGHADEFIADARRARAVVSMEADSVEFVKAYLARRQLGRTLAARVVDPCPGDPFGCLGN